MWSIKTCFINALTLSNWLLLQLAQKHFGLSNFLFISEHPQILSFKLHLWEKLWTIT
jgi:hypothetical protein